MSASLRVLAPEELDLVAGGSLDPSMDPNWVAGGSSYGWSSIPVYGATSWTTSSFGVNYQTYAAAAMVGGYASTNAYLSSQAVYAGANAYGQAGAIIIESGASVPQGTSVIADQPVSSGVQDGTLVVTAYGDYISYNSYWFTSENLQAYLGTAFINYLNGY